MVEELLTAAKGSLSSKSKLFKIISSTQFAAFALFLNLKGYGNFINWNKSVVALIAKNLAFNSLQTTLEMFKISFAKSLIGPESL